MSRVTNLAPEWLFAIWVWVKKGTLWLLHPFGLTDPVSHYLPYALGFLVFRVSMAIYNFVRFPYLRPANPLHHPTVSLLVPARNEAQNLQETLPKLLVQPATEILVLDDGSEDGTAQIAQTIAGRDPRFRLLQGQPLPEGWVGKSWACYQLAKAAKGEVLVFLDADVHLEKGALEAILAALADADLVSVCPRQRNVGLVERVLVPLIDVALLANIPYPIVPTNGQVMAFRSESYWSIGGHAAVRDRIVEDLLLGRQMRKNRKRVRVFLGGGLVGVRMYRSYGQIVEGLGKVLPYFHAHSRLVLVLSFLWHLGVYHLCWFFGFFHPLWWLVGALGLVERLLVNLKTGREWWELGFVPLAPLFSLPIY